jgi:hypothetical protein
MAIPYWEPRASLDRFAVSPFLNPAGHGLDKLMYAGQIGSRLAELSRQPDRTDNPRQKRCADCAPPGTVMGIGPIINPNLKELIKDTRLHVSI